MWYLQQAEGNRGTFKSQLWKVYDISGLLLEEQGVCKALWQGQMQKDSVCHNTVWRSAKPERLQIGWMEEIRLSVSALGALQLLLYRALTIAMYYIYKYQRYRARELHALMINGLSDIP